ncbi:MAG TPA: lamin tail domain-containing protein [Polyangiaceae bacterium]|nr:lamin tail domain-containing protein [Polyangiaceae bacterium]
MRSIVLAAALTLSCSSELELPEKAGDDLSVSLEPFGSLERAPPVFRLRVAEGARRSALSDYRMFFGELGAYHIGRIRDRNLPATLLERELPVLSWVEGQSVVVAPLTTLETGTVALATPELGLVAAVVVDATLVPVLERTWPPRNASTGAGTAIFCGELAKTVEPGASELAPIGVRATLLRGLDEAGAFSDDCVRIEPDTELPAGIPLLPPALAGSVALAPRLLVTTRESPERTLCGEDELALGPLCAAIGDDRIELRSLSAPSFVALAAPRVVRGSVAPGASRVVRGFEPASTTRVSGLVFDAFGARVPIDVEVATGSPRPHVVLNEMLANPAGAETTSEWIELVNDGATPVDLAGFVLDDAIEPMQLPSHELAVGEMVLLVAEGYSPDPELDLTPPPDVALVRLPRLGRNGLANAGELLRLRDPAGTVVSRFPALEAPGPGRSVGRRAPDAPDEASSFGAHAPPGASPGRPNTLEPSAQ